MKKEEMLKEYKRQEDKICLSQIVEKIEKVNERQQIQNTDFLDMYQISLVDGFLKKNKILNYKFFGGYENAERKVLVIYPEKYTEEMLAKNYSQMLRVVRVELNVKVELSHRNYLGTIVKLGLKREKVGDIIVCEEGADIITTKDFSNILEKEMKDSNMLPSSEVTIHEIEELNVKEVQKEEVKVIIPSFRLDNIVSDLSRMSRSKGVEMINSERVFVNGKCETKQAKTMKIGDSITIRGKGRFLIKEIDGTTRKGNTVLVIEKFV